MLSSGWQNISEKEKKIVETEKNLKQKERDLEVLEKKVNSSSSLLKEKEAEIIRRIANINVEEKVCFELFYCVLTICFLLFVFCLYFPFLVCFDYGFRKWIL